MSTEANQGPPGTDPSPTNPFPAAPSLFLPRQHRAEPEAGGRVRVRDVPVFAETTERAGRPQPFGLAWLRGALRADAAHRAEGYAAPMHLGHHEPGTTRERAGSFELTRLGLRTVEGAPRWVAFADLVFKDEASYERWRRDYPYRSIEISPDKPGELNSLALLSSEAPFHRFPVPTTFAALADGGVAFVWRTEMAEPEPEKKPEEKKDEGMGTFMEEMRRGMSQLTAFLGKLVASKDEEAPKPVQPVAAAAAALGASFGAEVLPPPPAANPAGARLEGELFALRAEVEKVRKAAESEKRFQALRAELAGYALGANFEARLRAHVDAGDADAWAEGIKAAAPALPGAGAPPPRTGDDPAVQVYAARGLLAQAREEAATFAALPRPFRLDAEGKPRPLARHLELVLGAAQE